MGKYYYKKHKNSHGNGRNSYNYKPKPITYGNSYGSKAYIAKHNPIKQIYLTVLGVLLSMGFCAFWIGLVIDYWLVILIGALSIGLCLLLIVTKSVKAHKKYSLKKF